MENGTCEEDAEAATCDAAAEEDTATDEAAKEGEGEGEGEAEGETTELFARRNHGIEECPDYTKLLSDGTCKADNCD